MQHVRAPHSRIAHTMLTTLRQLDTEHCDRVLVAIREVCDVPQERLLPTMSSASFFLALPGWIMPQSHNLTECMSVGAVPILEYDSFLRPPLQDGVNCLSYRGLAQLEAVIDHAMKMPEYRIEEMRRNVLEYYDENLSMAAVAALVRNCTSGVITVMAEEASVARANPGPSASF